MAFSPSTLTIEDLRAMALPEFAPRDTGAIKADLVFSTAEELVIAAGDMSGETMAQAQAGGGAFNGLLPGQVRDILDPVAFVSSVTNTQTTAGGSDMESDTRFRARIVNAFERITRGGSRQGYAELVKQVSPDIVDVAVIRPEPGHIHIYPLMADGVAPDATDAAILAWLDPETRIPMGDFVRVLKAVPQVFDVAMTLKVVPGSAASVGALAEDTLRARFAAWGQVLGAQVAPSALVEAVRRLSGVVGVTGPGFAFTDLAATEFARLGQLTITVTEAPNV